MCHGRDALAISDRRAAHLYPKRELVSSGFHCVAGNISDLVSRCVYSVFLMHRREDLWGPDGQFWFGSFTASYFLNHKILSLTALVFDPDRFLDDRLRKYLLPNPFIFLPFNAGPRICLGQQVSPSRS